MIKTIFSAYAQHPIAIHNRSIESPPLMSSGERVREHHCISGRSVPARLYAMCVYTPQLMLEWVISQQQRTVLKSHEIAPQNAGVHADLRGLLWAGGLCRLSVEPLVAHFTIGLEESHGVDIDIFYRC